MSDRKIVRLGTFELTGSVLRVSDPCYDPWTWCATAIPHCKPGTWEAAIVQSDEGMWGIRSAALIVRHADTGPHFSVDMVGWDVYNFDDIGVDSGQCGIYDEVHYQDDAVFFGGRKPEHEYGSLWYNHNCDATLSAARAGVIPFGAVSSSGYGDGSYTAYYHENRSGEIDGVSVVFIEDDAEENAD